MRFIFLIQQNPVCTFIGYLVQCFNYVYIQTPWNINTITILCRVCVLLVQLHISDLSLLAYHRTGLSLLESYYIHPAFKAATSSLKYGESSSNGFARLWTLAWEISRVTFSYCPRYVILVLLQCFASPFFQWPHLSWLSSLNSSRDYLVVLWSLNLHHKWHYTEKWGYRIISPFLATFAHLFLASQSVFNTFYQCFFFYFSKICFSSVLVAVTEIYKFEMNNSKIY